MKIKILNFKDNIVSCDAEDDKNQYIVVINLKDGDWYIENVYDLKENRIIEYPSKETSEFIENFKLLLIDMIKEL